MERARFLRVYNVAFVEEVVVSQLVAEEAARNVDLLAPNNNDLLAVEDLLRDNRRQPAKKMALAINDDGGRGESGHGESSRMEEGREKAQCLQTAFAVDMLDLSP